MSRPTWRPALPTAPSDNEALTRTVSWLRALAERSPGEFRLSLRQLLNEEILSANGEERERQRDGDGRFLPTEPQVHINTEPYFVAAWQLARMGILAPVPAIRINEGDITQRDEFVLTEQGRGWLSDSSVDPVLPAEQTRFKNALDAQAPRYGKVFRDRAIEALRCYNAHCFYACCVMCGAAAEAILLEVAAAKADDRTGVEADLRTAKGRDKLLNRIKSQRNAFEQKALDQFIDLTAYYRDDAAHGIDAPIDEEAAHLALVTLLRLARFVGDRWDVLVSKTKPSDEAS
jgi:hypothetical protein